jgi:hypothetical protein
MLNASTRSDCRPAANQILHRRRHRQGPFGPAATEGKAMHREGEEVHITTEEARGAVTGHGVRYVLGFGLATAVVALSAIWILQAVAG